MRKIDVQTQMEVGKTYINKNGLVFLYNGVLKRCVTENGTEFFLSSDDFPLEIVEETVGS